MALTTCSHVIISYEKIILFCKKYFLFRVEKCVIFKVMDAILFVVMDVDLDLNNIVQYVMQDLRKID